MEIICEMLKSSVFSRVEELAGVHSGRGALAAIAETGTAQAFQSCLHEFAILHFHADFASIGRSILKICVIIGLNITNILFNNTFVSKMKATCWAVAMLAGSLQEPEVSGNQVGWTTAGRHFSLDVTNVQQAPFQPQ